MERWLWFRVEKGLEQRQGRGREAPAVTQGFW